MLKQFSRKCFGFRFEAELFSLYIIGYHYVLLIVGTSRNLGNIFENHRNESLMRRQRRNLDGECFRSSEEKFTERKKILKAISQRAEKMREKTGKVGPTLAIDCSSTRPGAKYLITLLSGPFSKSRPCPFSPLSCR